MSCCVVTGIEKVFTVTARGCRQGEFKCRSGECITDRWKCDGKKVKYKSIRCFNLVGNEGIYALQLFVYQELLSSLQPLSTEV